MRNFPSALQDSAQDPLPGAPPGRLALLVPLLLLAGVLLVYFQVIDFDFIVLDDGQYVLDNPRVQSGLSVENLKWSFSTASVHNWHPLTWLSYMLDYELFGLDPGMFHLVNVFFHAVNTLLLFLLMYRATGAWWRSAVLAGLFAWHPMHVESVAWISERKDVLSTMFWLLATLAYVNYARTRRAGWYIGAFFALAAGLMTKAMLVTLPFTLLLLDYWPLGRFDPWGDGRIRAGAKLIGEKIPFFILVAAAIYTTLWAQGSAGRTSAVVSLTTYPWGERILGSLVGYGEYIYKTFLPLNLAAYYPYTEGWTAWPRVLAAGAVLLVVTALALWRARKDPWLSVGWFWFLGTLLPVIGLVKVGGQAMADRYSYVPQIGLFLVLVWAAGRLGAGAAARRRIAAGLAIVVLAACLTLTWRQVGYWRDTKVLFTRAVEVTERNHIAHLCLGIFARLEGKPDEAMHHLITALRIQPRLVMAHRQMAMIHLQAGRLEEAAVHLEEILRLSPNSASIRRTLEAVREDLAKNKQP